MEHDLSPRDVAAERRRRSLEFGYRVCGRWEGGLLGARPRICVMPHGHVTSPHRDADGDDFDESALVWPGSE